MITTLMTSSTFLHLLGVASKAAAAADATGAQGGGAAGAAAPPHSLFPLPSHWPAQTDLLQWCQTMSPGAAAILILAGIVYLLCGYYIYKWLVTLNALLVGAYVGAVVGAHFFDTAAAGAIVGGFTAGAITWSMMKYAIAAMGGIFGALLGASIWRQAGLDPAFAWSGAMTGLVAFGLFAFVVFRGSIIMYTSLQGAVMLVFGLLGMIYKYQEVAPRVTTNMNARAFILPLCVFIPAMIGLIYQQTRYPEAGGGKK
jgi:hypothetical protein